MGPSQGSSNSLLKGFHPFQLRKIAARYPNAATVGLRIKSTQFSLVTVQQSQPTRPAPQKGLERLSRIPIFLPFMHPELGPVLFLT